MKSSVKLILLVCAVVVAAGALLPFVGAREPFRADKSPYRFENVAQYDSQRAYLPAPRWERLRTPEQAGWSSKRLEDAGAFARDIHSDALLVVYNGLVVLDHGDPAAKYSLHSVRKSLMSVMVGIYNDKGKLDTNATLKELGIDDREGLSEKEKQATVTDLLTSRSGVYHPAAYETRGMRERRPERGAYQAGEHWFYNNWDFNTLVTIFNEQTGEDFFEAFESALAKPLGMEHFRLEDTRYRYEEDKSVHPAYLFRMSAADLARIGLLYLREGKFNGRQIVSKDWIDRSTSAIHEWDEDRPGAGYGYMWKVTKDGYYAAGRGGQRLYVVPKYNLVIVHLVDTRGGKRVKNSDVARLYRMILAAYQPEKKISAATQ